MPQLSSRLNGFTESIIRKMTRIANQYGAINLSQGFPDFEPPKEITQRLSDIALKALHNQYEITWGAQIFREKLAQKQSALMNFPIDPNANIVTTCGSTEAMMAAMLSVCEHKDKVIVFSPFYENYGADAILSGADPIFVPLKPPNFTFDETELEAAFKQGAKALILCNPSNPSGKVFTYEELSIIAKLAIKYDAFVITDEVYEHIVYKPHKHIYISSLPNMFERTISCGSLSKTYSITGWRLGYIIAPQNIIEVCKKVHDFLTVGAPAPLQHAVIAGLVFKQDYYDLLLKDYTRKKEIFLEGLRQAQLSFFEPQGAYYVLVDISKINKYKTDTEFCEWLAKEIGVAAVPGSSFFNNNENRYIRFHFAKKDETLKAAIQKLQKLKNL
ncbi:MAG: aminotransferase class I/II-fold pyridoxal phosphate-dependent enzyme [Elusimicrobiota bacterium]|jgi:aminotransferase|nr:aminotransferase class I/II-fold pyridoxal phosphate-dependent enzyme [Elusimicrobiota bacterium]